MYIIAAYIDRHLQIYWRGAKSLIVILHMMQGAFILDALFETSSSCLCLP